MAKRKKANKDLEKGTVNPDLINTPEPVKSFFFPRLNKSIKAKDRFEALKDQNK